MDRGTRLLARVSASHKNMMGRGDRQTWAGSFGLHALVFARLDACLPWQPLLAKVLVITTALP